MPVIRKAVCFMTPEMRISWYIQLIDGILVTAIPWLRWLAVAGFYVAAAILARWNIKRF